MAPPFDTNPLTIMWCLVTTSHVLVCTFPKYVKLVEMAMVQIVGSVEDEHCFYMLAFMKSKFHNKLTTHLPLLFGCLHNSFTLCKISCMQNVLNNGEHHNIVIVMMVKVGYILWSCWPCFYKGKRCYLCFYKGKFFLAHACVFLLLNLMVVLQASELSGFQSHWFFSLHDFLYFFLYTKLVDYRSLVLERLVLRV